MRPLDFSLEEISRFLTAVDDSLQDDAERQQAALTVLDEFAEVVEQRWLALKQQMEIADRFRTYLGQEIGKGSAGGDTDQGPTD